MKTLQNLVTENFNGFNTFRYIKDIPNIVEALKHNKGAFNKALDILFHYKWSATEGVYMFEIKNNKLEYSFSGYTKKEINSHIDEILAKENELYFLISVASSHTIKFENANNISLSSMKFNDTISALYKLIDAKKLVKDKVNNVEVKSITQIEPLKKHGTAKERNSFDYQSGCPFKINWSKEHKGYGEDHKIELSIDSIKPKYYDNNSKEFWDDFGQMEKLSKRLDSLKDELNNYIKSLDKDILENITKYSTKSGPEILMHVIESILAQAAEGKYVYLSRYYNYQFVFINVAYFFDNFEEISDSVFNKTQKSVCKASDFAESFDEMNLILDSIKELIKDKKTITKELKEAYKNLADDISKEEGQRKKDQEEQDKRWAKEQEKRKIEAEEQEKKEREEYGLTDEAIDTINEICEQIENIVEQYSAYDIESRDELRDAISELKAIKQNSYPDVSEQFDKDYIDNYDKLTPKQIKYLEKRIKDVVDSRIEYLKDKFSSR